MPERQNRHSSTWWFFLLFPQGPDGYGPRQLMFTIAARRGREMRITDVCTRLDDTIAIAALYRCMARMLYRLRRNNQRWRSYSTFLVNENRWLAQRFGTTRSLIDFGKGEAVPVADLVAEMVDLLREDAEYFGCVAEVEHALTIAAEGTSADRQMRSYDRAIALGASAQEALKGVVDHLVEETLAGCDM